MIRTLQKAAVAVMAGLILFAGTAWIGYRQGQRAGAMQVQAAWDRDRAETLAAMQRQVEQARQQEAALQTQIDQLRRNHRHEIARINARHTALVDSLRDRPEARAGDGGVPEGAGVGVGCTGAGLARPDAAFLIGYAADAARLQSALDACQAAYDEVRRGGGQAAAE